MPKAKSKVVKDTEFDVAEGYLRKSVSCVSERWESLRRREYQDGDSDLQRDLRVMARTWEARLEDLPKGKDLRSGLARMRTEISRRVFGNENYDPKAVWLAAQAWCLTGAIVRHLNMDRQSEVRSHIKARVFEITRNLDANDSRLRTVTIALRSVLSDCSDAIDEAITYADAGETKQKLREAADVCQNERTLARLASDLYLAPRPPHATDNAIDVDRLWSVVRVMSFLCAEVLGLGKALCDCYAQTESEDLLVVASSDQRFPGPPPDPFANRVVPRRHLLGGAAVATMSVIPNDHPDAYTNTHHQQEGSPALTLAVPTRLSENQVGEIFVSLKTKGKSWRDLEPALFCLLSIAKRAPMGSTADDHEAWISNISEAEPPEEFDSRLREAISEAGPAPTTRLAIFVISARPNEQSEQPESVRKVLDTWARTTALSKAKGDSVFKLPYEAAYGFIRRDVSDNEWESWRDGKELDLIEAVRPDGKIAGSLAGWVISWRENLRLAATAHIGEDDLYDLMRKQVRIGALEAVSLNALRRHITRGNYAEAYDVARSVVDKCGLECGLATNELIRMALLIGHFRTAKDYAEKRKKDAKYDVEGNLNRLLAAVALADLKSAEDEIGVCRQWIDANHGLEDGPGDVPLVYPMVRFACSLVEWLSGESDAERARVELRSALNQIARRSAYYASDVERCLDAVARWRARPNEETHRNAEEDFEKALDAFLRANRTDGGELEYWWELAALRRLIVVLRGYLGRMRPSPRRRSRRD